MRCPFPPCEWDEEPLRQQARFGSDEVNLVMPMHEVVGDDSWYGRCPGSMLIVPVLTPRGAAVIAEALPGFATRKHNRLTARIERARAEATAAEAAAAEAGVPTKSVDGIAEMLLKHGPRVDPRLSNSDYFPGRPADAPEPGPDDPPDTLPAAAKDALIINLNKYTGAEVHDSARDNLNSLVTLCVHNAAGVIEDLSRVQAAIERAQGMLAAADETAGNTRQLMTMTVGAQTDTGQPEPARTMVAMMALGHTTMVGNGDQSIKQSLAAALDAVAAAMNQVAAAKTAAEEYRGMPK